MSTAQPRNDAARRARTVFFCLAIVGIPVTVVSWTWYGLAQFEEQSEQSKALDAGTTMAGTGELMGGVPLIFVHIVGLLALGLFGRLGWSTKDIRRGVAAVAIVSLIGILAAELFFGGRLFSYGARNVQP
ncbi:hypothetical protein [Brevibacterium moorei]|uniref:hypothetical protein n=1 Tax=Brevibacterium moorei TaxID=2968457 RepID=UPI00211CD8BC|nr:hypothetical protein [Brevibacterium sp. 68QC2CO]MCQ9385778.1 hypothetical protein [Brevibacterium sp. 68QC2CO]